MNSEIKRLVNWAIMYPMASPYMAPEQMRPELCGEVDAHTAVVERPLRWDDTRQLIVAANGTFELGPPKADYEALYPGARERLIAWIKNKA